MLQRRVVLSGILAMSLSLSMGACAKSPSLVDPNIERAMREGDARNPSVPLDLRQIQVVDSGSGYRAVFLKLSRLPDSLASQHLEDPARIVVDIRGPTGAETEERTFPGGDAVVTRMRVSRQMGNLRVTLDLVGDEPPKYSVHQMADWVMIRLARQADEG